MSLTSNHIVSQKSSPIYYGAEPFCKRFEFWAEHGQIYYADTLGQKPTRWMDLDDAKLRANAIFRDMGLTKNWKEAKKGITEKDFNNLKSFLSGLESLMKIAVVQGDQRTAERCRENVREGGTSIFISR